MANLSASELAHSYGFAYSFLKSDSSLWKIFKDAVHNNWTTDKFTAELRNTTWWKKNADSVRQYQYLKSTDPATLSQKRAQLTAQIQDTAWQIGAPLNHVNTMRVVENALMYGWNDAQIRNMLADYTTSVNGVFYGQAGTDADAIRQAAWRNGVKLPGATIQAWVKQIAAGNRDTSYYQHYIRDQAKSLAPGYAQQLDAGMDLYDIASPYIQSKAQILEQDPQSIDLFDPDIRKALSNTTADGKPATMSLWQFEQNMRKNPAWLKTKNAQDSVSATARQVLTDFGFQGA